MIRLEEVTKRYGSYLALDRITVEVRHGAVGLLGPNGAGKSTLIKALLGLVDLTSGKASVCGFDSRTQGRLLRQAVGYMPEDDCVFSGLMGVQAVAFSGELAGIPSTTALRRAHEMLDYVTIGEERYREVQTYSTGMKQKVRLAQALVQSPKVVFLDEPTTGLDPQAREKMLKLIRDLAVNKGVGVVVSTHILRDVEMCCDSVLMVGKGRLLVYDTLENLRRPVDESFQVHFDGDSAAFASSLAREGLEAQTLGVGELRVGGRDGRTTETIFRVASEMGTPLRGLLPSKNSLEEIFLNALNEGRHADL